MKRCIIVLTSGRAKFRSSADSASYLAYLIDDSDIYIVIGDAGPLYDDLSMEGGN